MKRVYMQVGVGGGCLKRVYMQEWMRASVCVFPLLSSRLFKPNNHCRKAAVVCLLHCFVFPTQLAYCISFSVDPFHSFTQSFHHLRILLHFPPAMFCHSMKHTYRFPTSQQMARMAPRGPIKCRH